MQIDLTDIASTKLSMESIENIDCRNLLQANGVSYQEIENYLYVMHPSEQEGWILHLSVVCEQFSALLKLIVPFLVEKKIPFALAKSDQIVKHTNDGLLGYGRIGKSISIYSYNGEVLQLAKELIQLTGNFKGPAIPTDLLLKSIVYTMYGSYYSREFEHYTIPFRLPQNVSWPFYEITQPVLPPVKKLWNYRYKPLSVIKSDPKGRVIKGNYFKSLFSIKLCVIKEGVQNTWSDKWGRDATDRIQWQYELYKALAGEINTPKIFDLFHEQGNAYLVMEFIKGDSLGKKVASIFNGNSWQQLTLPNKQIIISYLFSIIDIVDQLHKKGFVHRDITPANFLINKKGLFHVIDMELTYSFKNNKPDPAFTLGTPGYTSPEQLQRQRPTIREDIYALGALMTFLFTGISPVKFEGQSWQNKMTSLLFFTDNHSLAHLIAKCLDENPEHRPSLQFVRESIEHFQLTLQQPILLPKNSTAQARVSVVHIINEALRGLINDRVMDDNNIWTSLKIQTDSIEGYQPINRMPQPGWQTGITGILYLIARASKAGYHIEPCMHAYTTNWQYVKDNYLSDEAGISTGLYDGLAGIAIAIKEGIFSGLLSNEPYKQYLESCFSPTSVHYTLADGLAGQGLALLQCRFLLETSFVEERFRYYVSTLLSQQQQDGSWNVFRIHGKKNKILPGLAHGVAGILYFLINYALVCNDNEVTSHIQKGLHWLIKNQHLKKSDTFWNRTTESKNTDKWGMNAGIPGIAVIFIKAYEWCREPLYKEIAEKVLHTLPNEPIHPDFTQAFGLAGLGEIYLEANRIFNKEEWKKRAAWIANTFIYTFITKVDKGGYWSISKHPDFEPDLITGASGIVHFLMRYQRPDQVPFILL